VWFPQHSVCPLSLSFHHYSVHTFTCIVLLQEGQTGEAWEPSKISALSEVWKQWVEKYCHLFAVFSKGRVCMVGSQWLAVLNTVLELRFVYRPGNWLSAFQKGHCCGLTMLHQSQASSYIESHCVCIDHESSIRAITCRICPTVKPVTVVASCRLLTQFSSVCSYLQAACRVCRRLVLLQVVRNRSAPQSLFGSAFCSFSSFYADTSILPLRR
jgi:hypothetical protein